MTTLSAYTTPSDIRAVLGVTIEELPDTILDSIIYYTQLTETLLTLNSGISTAFLVLPSGSPTANEIRFSNLVKTYSAYVVAGILLVSLPLFSFKHVKDSQAAVDRVLDPYAHIREDIAFALGHLAEKLQAAYAAFTSTTAPTIAVRVLVTSTGLGLNPITG